MLAPGQQIARDRKMRAGRGGDRGSVNHTSEFIERCRDSTSVFATNFGCSHRINIENRDQVRIWQFRIDTRVIAANVTDAYDANAQIFHRTLAIVWGT